MTDDQIRAFHQWLLTADQAADFVTLETAWSSGYKAALASLEQVGYFNPKEDMSDEAFCWDKDLIDGCIEPLYRIKDKS